jgi:hypothetical protein
MNYVALSRQLSGTEASSSPPSFLDFYPYTPVPILNHRATLLALIVFFIVTVPSYSPRMPVTELTLHTGRLLDILLTEAVYPICHPSRTGMG